MAEDIKDDSDSPKYVGGAVRRKAERIAAGICTKCGNELVENGNKLGPLCLQRARDQWAAKRDGVVIERFCACGAVIENRRNRICDTCRELATQITEKLCSACQEVKPINEFGYAPRVLDGRASHCYACKAADNRKRRSENPEAAKTAKRKYRQRRNRLKEEDPETYRKQQREKALAVRGLTQEQYDQKLLEQGGHCAFCDRTPEQELHGVLSIDHDHACCPNLTPPYCGRCFRFLLCSAHNFMLGQAKDDPAVLRKAADMLEQWAATRNRKDAQGAS